MQKMKIGISACLLGEKVRYDGEDKRDRYIKDTLGHYFEWIRVCPEVEYGLPVPREPMHLVGDPASPHIITIKTRVDHTEGMKRWIANRLRGLEREDLCGFIFKSKSPSCGIGGVKIHTPGRMQIDRGKGIFSAAFTSSFRLVPVIDDERLHNPALRENFIEQVSVYSRWKMFLKNRPKLRDLIAFHTNLKLLVLSHSRTHYGTLGRLVAQGKKYPLDELYSEYGRTMMEGVRLLATAKKNTNVLMHIAGYFKRLLSPEKKRELLEVIEQYRNGNVPLIAPLVLINHYVREFDEPYLKHQFYLNPYPVELMLRNHV